MRAKLTPAARDRRIAAAAVLLMSLAVRPAAAEPPPAAGLIGAPLATLVRTLGAPAGVNSGDSGNCFVFAGGAAAYADDDGTILALQMHTGTPRVEVDGGLRSFPIGVYSRDRADAELAAVAEFSTATLRSYRLAPRRDLVLEFAAGSTRLERLTYGEPGQLARLGLLPGDAATKAVVFRAPRPRATPAAGALAAAMTTAGNPGGTELAVFRLSVDRGGGVRAVDVAIASGDPAGDAEAARMLHAERYIPALLDGRPIAATVFVELRR